MKEFSVRLNCIDHYQALPTSFDPDLHCVGSDGKSISQRQRPPVPIVRVFGSTPTGQKVCAHVHGMFPYVYIQYDGDLNSEAVADHLHRLHFSIDHALAVSFRRDTSPGRTAFVAHVSLVKGVPFYGYYVGYHFFVKVYLYNPMHTVRLADLLRQGAVMRRPVQPYESHMQYVPQWMCDYNLFGCDYMRCGRVSFRSPVPDVLDAVHIPDAWHDGNIDPEMITNGEHIPRQSYCDLEVDVRVEDILNRHELKQRPIHHMFDEAAIAPPVGEKLVTSMAGLWQDETRRRKARMGLEGDDETPFPPNVLVSVSVDPRDPKDGGWIHEKEYRRKIADLIKTELSIDGVPRVSFENFHHPDPFEDRVQTSFESVEDLYPTRLHKALAARQHTREKAGLSNHSLEDVLDVDEESALTFPPEEQDREAGEDLNRLDKPIVKQQLRAEEVIRQAREQVQEQSDFEDSPNKKRHLEDQDEAPEGPNRPKGLEEMGVREAGDYVDAADDAFEIPADCVGSFEIDSIPPKTAKRPLPSEHHPSKRAKLEAQAPQNHSTEHVFDDHEENRNITASRAILDRAHQGLHKVESDSEDEHRPSNIQAEVPNAIPNASANGKFHSQIVSRAPFKEHTDGDSFEISPVTADGTTESGPNSGDHPDKVTDQASHSAPLPRSQASSDPVRDQQWLSKLGTPGVFYYALAPPLSEDVIPDLKRNQLPSKIYQDAFYSNDNDVQGGREYAGRNFRIPGGSVAYLPEFNAREAPWNTIDATDCKKKPAPDRCSLLTWEISKPPPTADEVAAWLKPPDGADLKTGALPGDVRGSISQIEIPTQRNKHGFKYSQRKKTVNVMTEAQYMSILSLEIHVDTRGTLLPDPHHDEVKCIFWSLQSNTGGADTGEFHDGVESGALILANPKQKLASLFKQQGFTQVDEEEDELDLLTRLVDVVRELDPDIITGYEVHNSSWGYLIERARHKYDYGLCDELSRVITHSNSHSGKEADRWGFNHTSTIRVTGRHMINIWRAMRGELNLLQYTMENVVFHVLHRRIPHYAHSDLTRWYQSGNPRDICKVIAYLKSRTVTDLEILDRNELVPRTSEQARLLGVDFYAVFARGSQFKVESLMFRIAKPENLLLNSPSRKQVGQQNALECLPLVMEPQSDFYTSPVLVLDFQSLYPSVMIAYNYCYSTFLGRVTPWRGQNKMGFTDYNREPRILELLKDHVNVAPNGIMYARPEMRKSLLAKMLGEILETRVMVKSGMKIDKEDRQLQRLLNNRQLALKLIANVTYGYTSASFSGRMPCSEIADSIVQTGRETLERAIALIHSVRRWNAEVVYGDTDSLFVHLKGRTRSEAFEIGQDIAKTVTDANPRPIKLKFEKVYHPCVLLAKKRYVGFKYESPDQKEPEFDAKGIETVRRDGTPAEQKIEETALKILFRSSDLSQVKAHFQRQCAKIMQGRVSIQDFCFAKEVKLGTYSDRGPPPPGALISARRMLADPRAEPQYGERVPYVVVAGAPGARLIDRCMAPDALLRDDSLELDADYYISKNLIPPLERIFNLVGANVRSWYDEMPKTQRIRRLAVPDPAAGGGIAANPFRSRKTTLESYMKATSCAACGQKLDGSLTTLCKRCTKNPSASLLRLRAEMRRDETRATELLRVCRSCADLPFGEEVLCDSKDCPVFYSRVRHASQMASRRGGQLAAVSMLEGLNPKKLKW